MGLLILRKLLRTRMYLKIPAYRLGGGCTLVYPPCTSLRRFRGFSPVCIFAESVSSPVSIPPTGSNPTPASKLLCFCHPSNRGDSAPCFKSNHFSRSVQYRALYP